MVTTTIIPEATHQVISINEGSKVSLFANEIHLSVVENIGAWDYNYTQTGTTVPCGLNGVCSATNKCGPYCWSEVIAMGSTTNKCGGTSQTPINLVQVSVDKSLRPPTFKVASGGCDAWVQFADDHAYEVSFRDAGCSNMKLEYAGQEYTLLQFHFHAPSEHAIGGGLHDAELHMVHASATGDLLVLGVMLDVANTPSDFLSMFWEVAEKGSQGQGVPAEEIYSQEYEVEGGSLVNAYSQFLPVSRSFFTYSGSLTTYPCTEGVRWIFFEQPINIGQTDYDKLLAAVKFEKYTITYQNNGYAIPFADNRPIQPVNSRTVLKYSDQIFTADDDEVFYSYRLSIAGVILGGLALLIVLVLCIVMMLGGGSRGSGKGNYGEVTSANTNEVATNEPQKV